MDAQRKDTDAQLKKILTPEQYAAWQNKMGSMKAQYENNAPKSAKAG